MRANHWIIAALGVFGTANCSDRGPDGTTDPFADGSVDVPDGTARAPDGTIDVPDGDVPDRVSLGDADAGLCCPIDPMPGCCMNYGGTRGAWGCGRACDGMPWPSDPRWQKRTDENGCEMWVEPPRDGRFCGGFFPEAGPDIRPDADADAPRDVTVDADAQDTGDVGLCCPIDPTPGCCMNYGGSRATRGCGPACDGMAWPNDPRWERRTDADGCEFWVDPPYDPARGVCGAPRPEAGIDAPIDVLIDTGVDRDGP